MAEQKQNSDGSLSTIRERDSAELQRVGGVIGPAGSNTPSFTNGFTLTFNFAGGTDTGGGILSWKNTLGYDVMVMWHAINVTTASSGACTVNVGQTATSGTTSSNNMISAQSVATIGAYGTTSPVAVLVPANTWITISTGTGASAALVGIAYFCALPVKG